MEELLILQEEQSLQKAKKFYNAIIAAANYIEFTKSENLEKVEDESQKYGKKLKPQFFS